MAFMFIFTGWETTVMGNPNSNVYRKFGAYLRGISKLTSKPHFGTISYFSKISGRKQHHVDGGG